MFSRLKKGGTFWKKNTTSTDNNEIALELQLLKVDHLSGSQKLIDLPPELLILILQKLEVQTFRTFRQCCKKIAAIGVFICFEQLIGFAKENIESIESLKLIEKFFKYFDDYLNEDNRKTLTDVAQQLLMKANKYSSVLVVSNSLYNAMQLRHKTALQFGCNSPIQYLKLQINHWDEKNKQQQKNAKIQKKIAESNHFWENYLKNSINATRQNPALTLK